MVFCPLGDSTGDSPLSDAALLDLGRREGELLASEFERIRKDTDSRQVGGWRNEPLAEALVDAALTKTMNRLAGSGRWGKENQSASAAFWEPVEPFMRHGWLQLRARTKPLGYAGDYELLEAICENRVADGPLGRIFDRYFLAQAAPAAVAARTEQSMIALAAHRCARPDGPYHYVGFQPGPALDIRRACSLLGPNRLAGIRVTLLDLDPAAVEYAAEQLRTWLPDDAILLPPRESLPAGHPGAGRTDGHARFSRLPGAVRLFR